MRSEFRFNETGTASEFLPMAAKRMAKNNLTESDHEVLDFLSPYRQFAGQEQLRYNVDKCGNTLRQAPHLIPFALGLSVYGLERERRLRGCLKSL